MKVIRKVIDRFNAMGTIFFKNNIVIINNKDVFLICKEHGIISVLYNYDTGNNVIETILDNSQDIK